jgi:hypothetical protein
LSAEIEADDRKIAELPELIEKTQEEAKSAMAKMKQCMQSLSPCLVPKKIIRSGGTTFVRQYPMPVV